MKPKDTTARGPSNILQLEFDLSHPIAQVWRALTQPELLEQWLLPSVGFELVAGTAFRFQAPPQPGWDGQVKCKIVSVEPQRRLSFTWVVGDMELDTVVTFELTPTTNGTHLALTHSGFTPAQKQNWAGARYGWNLMGNRLMALLQAESTGLV